MQNYDFFLSVARQKSYKDVLSLINGVVMSVL